MKNVLLKIAGIVAVVTALAAMSIAGHKPVSKVTRCSACHMVLSMHKTKMMNHAVKIGHKTMYCCSMCKMAKKGAMKGHGHMKGHMMMMKCPVCHMQLASHMMKGRNVAVRLKKGGMVMWCCNKCHMPAKVYVNPKQRPKR